MPQDWRVALARTLGVPTTEANLRFLQGWQQREGGHTNNSARFNWLNTTQNAPGATGSINSVGVKAFDNFQHGIQATASTLRNGRYDDILRGLASGDPYAAKPIAGLSTWVSGSPTKGVSYAGKVLGQETKGFQAEATEAYQKGPAKVVNSPSPLDAQRFTEQKVRSIMDIANNAIRGDFGANVAVVQGMQEAQRAFQLASHDVIRSEADANRSGGTTMPRSTQYAKIPGQLGSILQTAAAQIGKPYVWGAESPQEGGFDCSGLIDWAFKQAGIDLPGRLTTQTALKMGTSVRGQPYQPGDWLITNGGKHMVMYMGNGQVISAPRTGEVVQYQPVGRFAGQIVDVRRVLKPGAKGDKGVPR